MSNLSIDLALIRLEFQAESDVTFTRPAIRSLHGAVHRLLLDQAPELANRLHDAQEKPLTIAPLVSTSTGTPIGTFAPAGTRAFTTLGALTSNVAGALLDGLDRLVANGQSMDIGPARWRVLTWQIYAPERSRMLCSTYADLLASAPLRDLELSFVTPTTFRKAGDHLLHPGPHQVFGGYLRRWNAFAPFPLGIDLAEIDEHVALVESHTAPVRTDLGMVDHPGFTGWARYRVSGSDAFAAAIGALATYAPYCGTGARTAWGMGQTRCRILASDATS